MNIDSKSRSSAAVRAEAAAWVARLHGPNRTDDVEAGFRRWMSEDPEHAAAVELITDTWEKAARLRRGSVEQVRSWRVRGFRISFPRAALATAITVMLAVVSTVFSLRTDDLVTRVGELRTLALEDGTRVYLNTDTVVVPRYSERVRSVEVEKGEALFEVVKNPDRPFIVTAGDHQIRALGTSFVVRRDRENLAVTLVEGKVTVTPALPASAANVAELVSLANEPSTGANTPNSHLSGLILKPGERVIFRIAERTPEAPARENYSVDKPSIERVTAWQRGLVSFDDTVLADAVAEMNRYSKIHIVVEDQATASIRISGIFRAGDQDNFARAIAKSYAIETSVQDESIVMTGRADKAK